jgi:hypothetical protein
MGTAKRASAPFAPFSFANWGSISQRTGNFSGDSIMSKTESLRHFAPLFTLFLFFGCSHITREQIMEKGLEGASIFEEISEKNPQIPEGYSELLIKASIKIPQKEFYPFYIKPPRHENSQYPFVININGQGALWAVNCILDEQAMYVHQKRNPEGGEGLLCRLEKRIHLKPGSYLVYFGLPDEEFKTEVTISLTGGSSNVLEFKPIYWQGGNHRRTFRNGISKFDIFLNGEPYLTHTIHRGGR